MTISALKSKEEFDKFIKDEKLLVIHFYAPWADQCTQINSLLVHLAKSDNHKDAKYATIEAEEIPEVSLKYKVSAVPTIILIKNSKVVDRVDGVNPGELGDKIAKHLKNESCGSSSENSEIKLEERLKKLINQAPCMLFMKGNPTTPKCGFSRTIVGILDSLNADYQTFDILEDNAVREGLKKFSNWPTYPQLYINGELIGGLDIVKEMNKTGELSGQLPKKS
ncbi:glutaredoxin 3 [Chelonus insularis]|uniref:glutaredoxin 3 n=1 Tax=Chelonus insularis TaxID=460826 RepID=UPI00158A344B|nr:glutaredoxin 3 [Chelonus insularis]XP_034940396.1 glutaredoxin 3 [Chelonus insularis]